MNALTVTPKDYATAVQKLMDLAADHLGGSSEAAAQVLLSAYNGHEFKLDVTDLCSLDQGNRMAAYTVMEGRCGAINLEPHRVIPNGAKQFNALWEDYAHLKIRKKR